ncbi:MAG: MBL fold metallo-hydrolase [Patescibacteria group bacterium]
MVITYYGKQFFKLQLGDTVIAVNPISKDSRLRQDFDGQAKLSGARFGADVGLISVNHPDYNGAEVIGFGEKQPLIISGPGEYETKGIFIKGFPSEAELGGKKFINTIYTLSLDNINICILGALATKQISAETKEAIDGVDMLFVPVGLSGLTPREAYNLASSFESKVIIPMDYDSSSLKVFLKEGGAEGTDELDKYTVKRKDIENMEGEIILLKPQG